MNALKELIELSELLPNHVLEDVMNRTRDWLSAGGGEDDPYIHQQLRYAKQFIEEDVK